MQSQVTSVICFCYRFSCCPYYESVSRNSKGFLPLPVSTSIFTLAPDLSFACLGVLGLCKNMGLFAILTVPCYGNNCTNAVFSLNFSSAGKGPFIASKEKNMHQRRKFLGADGKWIARHAPPPTCWEIWELSSLKRHSLVLRPILRNHRCYLYNNLE